MYSLVFDVKREDVKDDTLLLNNLIRMMLKTSSLESMKNEEFLKVNNLVWILYSWNIKLNRPIKVGEKIKISTWASGFKKIKCFREFLIESEEEIVAKCSSEFLILDYYKRKTISVPDEIISSYDILEEKLVDDIRVNREEVEIIKEIEVMNSDMDNNNHVNNVVYIKWLEESINKQIMELKLVYSREIDSLCKIKVCMNKKRNYYEILSDKLHAKGYVKFL